MAILDKMWQFPYKTKYTFTTQPMNVTFGNIFPHKACTQMYTAALLMKPKTGNHPVPFSRLQLNKWRYSHAMEYN